MASTSSLTSPHHVSTNGHRRHSSFTGRVGKLSTDQLNFLNSLRESLLKYDAKLIENDHALLRFLRARKFNVELAKSMYIDHIAWRKEIDLDNILISMPPKSNILQVSIPCSFHGFDKENRPLYFERTDEEILKAHLWSMEISVYRCFEASTLEKHIETFTSVMDLTGLSLSHRNALSVIQLFSACDQKNYPERMGALYVINAPSIFPALWNVAKGWIDPVTARKIHILGDDYKETLLSIIDEDVLPEEYGGKCKCANGCVPHVSQAEFDKELNKVTVSNDCFEKLKIKAGEIFKLTKDVKKDVVYNWHFFTDNSFDYSLNFNAPNSRTVVITKPKNIISSDRGFYGQYKPKENGVLEFTFDNKSSWMTSKNIKFGFEIGSEVPVEQVKKIVLERAKCAKVLFDKLEKSC